MQILWGFFIPSFLYVSHIVILKWYPPPPAPTCCEVTFSTTIDLELILCKKNFTCDLLPPDIDTIKPIRSYMFLLKPVVICTKKEKIYLLQPE